MVVHADDGMDEISICSPTYIAELREGEISTYSIDPEQFGMQQADIATIRVDGPQQSLAMIRSVLADTRGPAHDIVCLNAGAAIYVAGLVGSLELGISRARQVIASGQAGHTLANLVEASNA